MPKNNNSLKLDSKDNNPYLEVYTRLSEIFPQNLDTEEHIKESFLQEISRVVSCFEIYTDPTRLVNPNDPTKTRIKNNIELFFDKENISENTIEYGDKDSARILFSSKYIANIIKNSEDTKPNYTKERKLFKDKFIINEDIVYSSSLYSSVKKRNIDKPSSSYSEAKINGIGTYNQLLSKFNNIASKIDDNKQVGYRIIVDCLIKSFKEGVTKIEDLEISENHNLNKKQQQDLKLQIFNLHQLLIHEATRKSRYYNSSNHKQVKEEFGKHTILSSEIIMYQVILLLEALDKEYITLDKAIQNHSKYFFPTGTKLRKKSDSDLIVPLFNTWLVIREQEKKQRNNINLNVEYKEEKQRGYTPLKRAGVYNKFKKFTTSEDNNGTPGKESAYNTPETIKSKQVNASSSKDTLDKAAKKLFI